MNTKLQPYVIFINGASGAGKTSIVNELARQNADQEIAFLHFNSSPMPSEEEMIEKFGSGSAWQEYKTYQEIKNIATKYSHMKSVIIEGQSNFDFIIGAFKAFHIYNYEIILIYCADNIRHLRLKMERNQPHLINQDMDNWSKFLFNQAIKYHSPVINTSNCVLEKVILEIKQYM